MKQHLITIGIWLIAAALWALVLITTHGFTHQP